MKKELLNDNCKVVLSILLFMVLIVVVAKVSECSNELPVEENNTKEVEEEKFTGEIIYSDQELSEVFEYNIPSEFKDDGSTKELLKYKYKKTDEFNFSFILTSVSNYKDPSVLAKNMAQLHNAPSPFEKKINEIIWYNIKYGNAYKISSYYTVIDNMLYMIEFKHDSLEDLSSLENSVVKSIKLK